MDYSWIVLLLLFIFQIKTEESLGDNDDKMGASELKVLTDLSDPILICVSVLTVSINTTAGTRVDLHNYFSDADNVTYNPGRYISVNISTLGKPQQVSGILENNWGIEPSCTFLIYTKAEVCFPESLTSASNAEKVCLESGGNKTCIYTCKSGYFYFDGSFSKTYTCSGMNNWLPSSNLEDCLLTESPSYKAKFEVVYELGDLPASQCLQGFDNSLAVYNTTIAQKVDDRCKDLKPGKFVINSFISSIKAFQITTVFSGEFTGSGSDTVRSTCLQTLYIIVNVHPSSFLHNDSIICDGGIQSSVSVISIKGIDDGNECSDIKVLIKPSSGNNEQCVHCPPGRYFNGTSCVMCADGQYQDLVGKTSCKTCPTNTVSRDDKTVCIVLCPPGFTSKDGMTECKPCYRDEYWVNATNCERCPADYKTFGKKGVPDITGCKAPCPTGRYSSTGFEPCQDCPFHNYKTAEGQGNCTKCPDNQRTLTTGSNSSADCIDLDGPPKVTCPSAKTVTVINSEVTNFTINPTEVLKSENIGIVSTTYNPPYLTVSRSYIGTTRTIIVTVTDTRGRTDQCHVQVYTAAASCSPYSLESPVNGQKNCSATSKGFQCDLKCAQTYTFYDDPGLAVKTLTCTSGNPWPTRIPACTPLNQQALYTSLVTMNYHVEIQGQTIGSSCFEYAYKSAISTAIPLTEQILKSGCSGGLFPNDNIEIDIKEESSFASTSINIDTLNITYVVEQKPFGYMEPKYSACAVNMLSRMQSFDVSIKTIQSQVPGCPNLVRTGAAENSKGFVCSADKKRVTVGGIVFCLICPAGTYLRAPNTCYLCPVNTYKSFSGATACTPCGSGRGTHITGATSSGQCLGFCSVGSYSTSGMPPCNLCPRNTYWVNSTYCQACPNGGKTVSVGSSNIRNCIPLCSAGKYSFTGYEPCQDCPLHHYKTVGGQGNCTECPQNQRTMKTGSNSSADCVSVETDGTSPVPYTTKGKETSTSGEKTPDDLSGKENKDDNYFNYFVIISTVSVILLVILLVVVVFLLRRKLKKRDSKNSNYTKPSPDVQESEAHSYSGFHDYSEFEEGGSYTELDSIQREDISTYEPSISNNRDYINTERHVTDVTHVYTDLQKELNYEN